MYQQHKARLGGLTLADVSDRIRTGLIQQDHAVRSANSTNPSRRKRR